jgi:hypothetical protein
MIRLLHPWPLLGVLLGASSIASCDTAPSTRDYRVSLFVDADPGVPLAGAVVTRGERRLGESDATGEVAIEARGAEGSLLIVRVSCPDGYASPSEPLSIVLRSIAESDRRPEYRARCELSLRTVVVAVRTDQGVSLPLLYLGREVARTDDAGAAHFMLEGPPDDGFELTLDTSAQPSLRPQNPSARFQVAERDDVLVFSQKFQVPPRRKPAPPARAPRIIRLSAARRSGS